MLDRNDLLGVPDRRDDVGHTADDADVDPVEQTAVVEARLAEDQTDPLAMPSTAITYSRSMVDP